jgi:phage-related protein
MMVNEIMDTTAGRLAKVNAESQNAGLGFGGLTAQLKEAFAGFTTLLGPLASTAQALGPSLLQGAVAGLTAALPALIANVGGLHAAFGAVSTFISGSIIPLLTNPLTLAIMGVIATVGLLYMAWQNNWGGIRDITANVVSALQNIWSGFSNWMQEALNAFVSFFKEYWVLFGPAGWIYHAWEENWFGIRDLFNNVASQIENGFTAFKSSISDAWSGFLSWINNNTGPALDTLKNTFASGFQAISNAVSKATDWWKSTLGGFLDWLKDAENTIDDWVKRVSDAFSGWAKGIQDWWSGLVKSISGTTVEAPTFKPPRGYMAEVEVPAMQKGGLVPETGLYMLHAGEYVVPPNQPAMNVTINLNVTGTRGMNEKMLAEEAARQIERRLRSVLIEKTSSQAKTSRIRL